MRIALQTVLLIYAILFFFGATFDKKAENRDYYLGGALLIVAVLIVTLCLF